MRASIELLPWERNNVYTVAYSYNIVIDGFPDTFLPYGYEHDADSVVPNYRERNKALPPWPAPEVHDWGYDFQCCARGKYHSQDMWDELYLVLCKASTNPMRRFFAPLRYWGLNTVGLGGIAWRRTPHPLPIPHKWDHYFGITDSAIRARSLAPVLFINDKGRLDIRKGFTNDTLEKHTG